MSRKSLLCEENGTALLFVELMLTSTMLNTPAKAAAWFRNYFRASGCVQGGLVPGEPGVYAWTFYLDSCLKTQLSDRLWSTLFNFERDFPDRRKIFVSIKEKKFHFMVISDQSPRQVTVPVDADLYQKWDKKCSFHVWTLDPDEKAKYLSFGHEP